MFVVGAVISIFQGVHELIHPSPVEMIEREAAITWVDVVPVGRASSDGRS